METKFNDFLNEYGGPYKTAGFRYSKPSIEYVFSLNMIVNPEINIQKLTKDFKDIFDKYKLEQDNFNFMKEDDDIYNLRINLTAYSKLEIESAMQVILKEIMKLYNNDIIFIAESLSIEGPDNEIKRKPIGY